MSASFISSQHLLCPTTGLPTGSWHRQGVTQRVPAPRHSSLPAAQFLGKALFNIHPVKMEKGREGAAAGWAAVAWRRSHGPSTAAGRRGRARGQVPAGETLDLCACRCWQGFVQGECCISAGPAQQGGEPLSTHRATKPYREEKN